MNLIADYTLEKKTSVNLKERIDIIWIKKHRGKYGDN